MSYPKNLGNRIQYLSNYNTNTVKLNPDNNSGTIEITSSNKVQFTFPPNSLVDVSSFSIYADFETDKAVEANSVVRPHYLTRYTNSLIRRLTVEIGGQTISDIEDYNRIQQIFSDYQFGIEGSSKKLLSNIDPLDKRDADGVQIGGLRPLSIAAGHKNTNLRYDKRPICLSQFLGWLGGGAGVKYIDTQLTGNVKVTVELAPANNVLFRANRDGIEGMGTPVNGITDGDCTTQAKYKLENLYATIKKVSIDDGVYFASVSQALSAGIPFEYKYNGFYQTKGPATAGDSTLRYELMSNSVDLVLLSFSHKAFETAVTLMPDVDLLEGSDDVENEAALLTLYNANAHLYPGTSPSLNAKTLATLGKMNCFCSGYFKRCGSMLDTVKFYVNGERLPQYDMKNPQVYNQLLIDMGIHDDTANGIYYGINSYDSWKDNYWVASARLSHVSEDDSFISGFNSSGVPLTITAETTKLSAAPNNLDFIPQMFVMTSEVMQVYSGRQINRVK
jgi:hypothetical protein